ncbi:MAG: 50S ribosomal protein L9 [Nitrospiraceae bacterium]|nr:50S ribosomal protein L9 [Nitrospiraceae bacterium]
MKVILKDDVKNLGRMGDTVMVKTGYARNFLFPKNLAAEASEKNVKQLEALKKQLAMKAIKIREDALAVAERLNAMVLNFKVKAGEEGKLFGSVTAMDLEEAIKAQGVNIDRKKFVLDEPLKRLGTYTVQVKLFQDVNALVTVNVEPEQE